jgi:hypothetical protein
VAPTIEPCPASSTAPAGCLASTIIPPDDRSATLWVSRPTGAQRAIRAADQRAAEGIALAPSDLPGTFETSFAGGDDCLNPKGESALTITGESESPTFYDYTLEPPSLAEATSLTRVYASVEQARQAFAREGRLPLVRCVINALDAGEHSKTKSLKLGGVVARARAFRTAFRQDDLTVNYDVVFLQRGRSVTTLQLALLNAPAGFESGLVARVAARMR